MFTKKNILTIAIIIGMTAVQMPAFADELSDIKTSLSNSVRRLMQLYELRIQELETENNALKLQIISLKGTGTVAIKKSAGGSNTSSIITPTSTKSEIYTAVIKQVNNNLSAIISENNLPAYSAIGLFEFIEPNAVFISLDDGANPAGVTAFKSKVLYTFDTNLVFTRVGLFDLDYASQKYRTLFGNNPYTKSTRIRMDNPSYKGKLLEILATSSTGSGIITDVKTPIISSTENIVPAEMTFAQIKTAYGKNKNLDVLKMSDEYIVKNPNDAEVLKMRYRSYYFISKYDNALTEIKKIETIQGASFEKTIACDAAVIGKIAKKTDISAYYSAICKKK
jgi:hypothetical protein